MRWYTTAGPEEQERREGIGILYPGKDGDVVNLPKEEALQTWHLQPVSTNPVGGGGAELVTALFWSGEQRILVRFGSFL